VSRFEISNSHRSAFSRRSARWAFSLPPLDHEGRRSAERRIVNKPRLIPRIAGKQHHTATPFGAPPRRLKTLVRSSGDVATLGDFAPHACPRPATSVAEPLSGPGRKPRASRVRGCKPQPRAPHPTGLGYPAPAKLKALSHFGVPSRSAPHRTGRQQDKRGFGGGDRYTFTIS